MTWEEAPEHVHMTLRTRPQIIAERHLFSPSGHSGKAPHSATDNAGEHRELSTRALSLDKDIKDRQVHQARDHVGKKGSKREPRQHSPLPSCTHAKSHNLLC
jgi:hypothetical protein